MDWYNGYSPNERSAMGRAKAPPVAKQPLCAMCGDPSPRKMETHAEDYSRPYVWTPPCAYPVCNRCHSRLHSRFEAPLRWQSFLAFLRRGWFAQEVSSADLNRLTQLGDAYRWRELPHSTPSRTHANAWWWESLTMDKSSLQSPSARAKR